MSRLKPALPALIVAVAMLARLIPGPRTIDDAFITFRYARNLLAGTGFAFNPGETVLGTTTPLYTLLMAGLGALVGGVDAPFPLLALLVNTLADAATCLLLWGLGRRLGYERAGLAVALAWAVAPFSVTFAIGGLETSLYVALLSGTVYCAICAWRLKPRQVVPNPAFAGLQSAEEGRPGEDGREFILARILAALLASFALLTRPDALILLGPLALERLWAAWKRRESIHWAELAAAILPYGAWAAYAAWAFGSPLPHSILAKAVAYRLEAGDGLIRLVQHYTTPFLEQNLLGAPLAVGMGLFLYPFLFFLGARALLKARPPLALWAWALYPWLYLVVFAIPNPLIFRWYLTPPLPAYFFFIFAGLDALVKRLEKATADSRRSTQIKSPSLSLYLRLSASICGLLFFVPAAVSLADWRPVPDHGGKSPAPQMAFIKLELLYRQAADLIAPRLSTSTLLAAGDVGVLGFYTPARILDTVGLNSPISTSYYPLPPEQYVINYAIPTELILDQRPDWIVTLEVYGRRTFLPDPRYQAAYRLVEKIPTDMYGSDGMLIFQKKP